MQDRKRDTDVQNRLLDSMGEGEGGMIEKETQMCRQKKRHRCIEQTFGLYGRRLGWDDLREQHQNMYIIKCETDRIPGWMHETSAQVW